MLRYYARQFDIAASTDDRPLLKETAVNVRRVWTGVRSSIEAKGGIAEAARFNDLVDQFHQNGLPGELGARLQDRIYELEQLINK